MFPWYIATVGNDADVTKNAVCIDLNTMTDGGWYLCPKSLTGNTFGVYSTKMILNFISKINSLFKFTLRIQEIILSTILKKKILFVFL